MTFDFDQYCPKLVGFFPSLRVGHIPSLKLITFPFGVMLWKPNETHGPADRRTDTPRDDYIPIFFMGGGKLIYIIMLKSLTVILQKK